MPAAVGVVGGGLGPQRDRLFWECVDGNDGETTSNDNATSPREGGTSEVPDHNLASERQQAHTRKRAPAAAPPPPPRLCGCMD
jgi:hypothetical protein